MTIQSKIEPEITPTESPALPTYQSFELTVEHLLYAAVVGVAIILRLPNLGALPLSPQEAQEALAVWSFWHPSAELYMPSSPAYFTLTSFLTQIAGNSDGVMRLIPVLFGILLVLMPFGLRYAIGRGAAIITSLFLAISPTFVSTSRLASGETIALTALLGLTICWYHYQETGSSRWLTATCAVLGIGLASAPIFFGGLFALLIARGLEKFLGPELFKANISSTSQEWRSALLTGGGFFIATSTFFLWNLASFGSAANLGPLWLQQFAWPSDVLIWLDPILALGRYEAAALLLGTLIAAWATWRSNPVPNFVTYWFLGSILLMLAQAGNFDNVLLVALPGYMLIGIYTEHLLQETADWSRWPLGGLALSLGVIAAANIGRYARNAFILPNDFSNLALATTCILLVLLVAVFVFTWDRTAALQGLLIPLLIAFAVLAWSDAWWLAQFASNDPRERWIQTSTDDDMALLTETIVEIARQTGGADSSLSIFSSVDHPVMRWYLRDQTNIQFGEALPTAASQDLIITPLGNGTLPELGSDYTGSDFGFLRPETDHVLAPSAALRWWFFRQSQQRILEERVILWLRTDLISGEE